MSWLPCLILRIWWRRRLLKRRILFSLVRDYRWICQASCKRIAWPSWFRSFLLHVRPELLPRSGIIYIITCRMRLSWKDRKRGDTSGSKMNKSMTSIFRWNIFCRKWLMKWRISKRITGKIFRWSWLEESTRVKILNVLWIWERPGYRWVLVSWPRKSVTRPMFSNRLTSRRNRRIYRLSKVRWECRDGRYSANLSKRWRKGRNSPKRVCASVSKRVI